MPILGFRVKGFSGPDFGFRDNVFRGRFLNFDGILPAFWLILVRFFEIFRVVVRNFPSHLAKYPKILFAKFFFNSCKFEGRDAFSSSLVVFVRVRRNFGTDAFKRLRKFGSKVPSVTKKQ